MVRIYTGRTTQATRYDGTILGTPDPGGARVEYVKWFYPSGGQSGEWQDTGLSPISFVTINPLAAMAWVLLPNTPPPIIRVCA